VEDIAKQIKEYPLKAQYRMKLYADKNISEREHAIGDMVYLKLQPYRHTSLNLHRSPKLHSKYYGPFRVLQKNRKYFLQDHVTERL
jgi:hypothetical protein